MTGTSSHSLKPSAGKIVCHAMWAQDGRELAEFYAAALGTEVSQTFPGEDGNDAAFAFYLGEAMYLFYTSASFVAPNWPQDDLPFHLDLMFDDVASAEKQLLQMGATKPAHQPGGRRWTVLLDPSGQPFCLHASS
ncbi:VOC family protein [Streptomyces sp. WZ-12]|uniref:VOC family protein n=1 Tax=Streptomyces sp. WZ-12 TaxID=3030210 RepID=UPI0023815163|nr:VOC family protein [Streptomyces sp. WZ-12]